MHAALLIALASVTSTQTINDEQLRGCARLSQDDKSRLACFDRLAAKIAPPDAVAVVDKGRWSTSYEKSEMDDSTTVVLSLVADRDIRSWPNKATRPSLVIRCKENSTAAYIVTGAKANPELGNYNSATARIRIDDGPTVSYSMSESTDGEALFVPQPIGKLKQWEGKQKLTFEFTPFNSSPQTTTFAIAGMKNALAPLRAACKW
jgi:type VI secretion system protein VasI